jgi:hypothetical protein
MMLAKNQRPSNDFDDETVIDRPTLSAVQDDEKTVVHTSRLVEIARAVEARPPYDDKTRIDGRARVANSEKVIIASDDKTRIVNDDWSRVPAVPPAREPAKPAAEPAKVARFWSRPRIAIAVAAASLLLLAGAAARRNHRAPTHAPVAAAHPSTVAAPPPAASTAPAAAPPTPSVADATEPADASERAAVEAVASGSYAQAARIYRALAIAHPNNEAYREAARILLARSKEGPR